MATGLEAVGTSRDRHDLQPASFGEPSATAALALFDSLDEAARGELLDASTTGRANRHQVIFCAGEKLKHMYVVLEGSLKLVRHSEEGKELIVSLVTEGEAFGSPSQSREAPALAQALEGTTLLLVPHTAVRRAMDSCTEFALSLIDHIEQRQQRAELAVARIAFDSVPRRLAQVLLDSSETSTGSLRFPLNQTEIANLIGSSRETVCSILNQFRRSGWLEIERGRIRVVDRAQLASVR